MCEDPVQGDIESAHFMRYQSVECVQRLGCWFRSFVVSKDDNTDVALVVILHMCALIYQGACLPDASSWVDRIVITDICPLISKMPSSDRGQSANRIGISTRWKRADRVVMDRNSFNLGHRVGHVDLGPKLCPLGSLDDEVWYLIQITRRDLRVIDRLALGRHRKRRASDR